MNTTSQKNLWWGYLHTSGSLQAKRYFDERDLDDAYESSFCAQVVRPFEADTREEALEIVKQRTLKRNFFGNSQE